jgi:hypothetical protein
MICNLDTDVVLNIKEALRELNQGSEPIDIEGVVNEILDEEIILKWCAMKKKSKKKIKSK